MQYKVKAAHIKGHSDVEHLWFDSCRYILSPSQHTLDTGTSPSVKLNTVSQPRKSEILMARKKQESKKQNDEKQAEQTPQAEKEPKIHAGDASYRLYLHFTLEG